MLKDMTLGQFLPGNSLLHKLDPRMKIILVIMYIVAVFSAKSIPSFALISTLLVITVAVSGINVSTVLKSMKPLIFIMTFTAIMNLLWTQGEHLVLSFWVIRIYKEGIIFAIFMLVRLICLVSGTFVILTYTTSPVALTDAMERMSSPLKKIGVPTHEFAMMMSIALRFIPTLIEETDKIISAQKARGANFETGSVINKAKAIIPVLIPLFVSAFRRADELASAMECRLYRGGEGRTRMKILKLHFSDYASLCMMTFVTVAVYFLNSNFPAVI